MPTIIRALPFYDRATPLHVNGRRITVQRDQIVVWVSVAPEGMQPLEVNWPRLPAVIDTGCNHSFILRQEHLLRWAGIPSAHFHRLGPVRAYGELIPQFAADVWLHPNRQGQRDELADSPPYLLETDQGVAIVPDSVDHGNPRLPLLGLRALRRNHLHMAIDGYHRSVTIRARRRFWLFG